MEQVTVEDPYLREPWQREVLCRLLDYLAHAGATRVWIRTMVGDGGDAGNEEREELLAHRPHDYSFADNQDKYT